MNIECFKTNYKLGKPVLEASGIDGTYDKCAVDGNFVFWHNSRYYLIHFGYDGLGYQSALATSHDLLHWEPECVIFPRGCTEGWDKGGIAAVWILRENDLYGCPRLKKVDGKYWLIYHSYPGEGYEAGSAKIGLAYTEDETLHQWTTLKEPILSWEDGADWEKCGLYKGCMVEHEGKYYMFYNAKDSEDWIWHEQIGLAISDDMIHWTRPYHEPVIRNEPNAMDNNFCADPCVVWDGQRWVMFYYVFDGVHAQEAIAFSEDLYHWEKYKEALICNGEKGSLDEYHAHKPSVVVHEGVLYHFYTAVRSPHPDDKSLNADPTKPDDSTIREYRCITVAVSDPKVFRTYMD